MRRELRFTVEGVEKHILPRLNKIQGTIDEGGSVIFEFHDELELSYARGERLTLVISSEKIPPARGDDYCGRAFLYKIIEGEGERVYLFSMGGYIFRLALQSAMEDLKIAEFYYICVSKS